MAQVVTMMAERTRDVAGRPFSGAALAAAIVASAQSQPLGEPALHLPADAQPCDLAVLEREFATAVQQLSEWMAQQDRALAAAPLGSPLKISVGVVRAAAATLDGVIRACRDLRAAGHAAILIDFGPVRDLVNDRPGLLAQTVAATVAQHGTLRAIA
ncbi:hypothetical protein [Azospirillum rugosum]|uniref:Luciferase-like monooxygenase n=1 Tax=Azospirillum rugosum TaxID=416170 RepID=A0ABS4SX48_9PROT|nr:hypothetical protein [Azospirillum rugosum]MBP2296542.1 hypothetical protein [Azospirillum rugosum]MDQ0530058.1 hypothetical protein [Azospirillum rugosum]